MEGCSKKPETLGIQILKTKTAKFSFYYSFFFILLKLIASHFDSNRASFCVSRQKKKKKVDWFLMSFFHMTKILTSLMLFFFVFIFSYGTWNLSTLSMSDAYTKNKYEFFIFITFLSNVNDFSSRLLRSIERFSM